MNRLIVVISSVLVATFFSNLLHAQGLSAKGVKAGVGRAFFGGEDADIDYVNRKSVPAFAIAGFVVWKITDSFGLRPEVVYTNKGAKSEVYAFEVTVSGNYLELPVLIQYTPSSEGSFQPNIFLGPSIGFFLNGTVKRRLGVQELEEDIKSEEVKSPEFGLILGVGATLIDRMTIEIQHNLSLTSSDKAADLKNRVISSRVGFLF